jgi:cell division protein FtsI/penicillin-binding protein 2
MPQESLRPRVVLLVMLCLFVAVLTRLFYWQVVESSTLSKMAERQQVKETTSTGLRGKIFTTEGELLVGNTTLFHLMLDKNLLTTAEQNLIDKLAPLLVERDLQNQEATQGAELKDELLEQNSAYLDERLNLDSTWVRLASRIDRELKEKIDNLQLPELYFEQYQTRFYPEASMAAHITGFVGKNSAGQDTGYFGVEGALDKELSQTAKVNRFLTDALGNLLGGENILSSQNLNGRDVVLTIRRDVQYLLEQELQKAITRYGAAAGEIIVMDPKTGAILGLSGWPNYDQAKYYEFETSFYKNPTLVNTYEPGSTFKVLTVSAGLDAEAITPETECPFCDGPREIGKFTIRTWNNEYHPNVTVRDALALSDNVAMINVAETMGRDTFVEYLKKFGIGEQIDIDLQEDTNTPFPDKWGAVELATSSFGQGISTTSLQMIRAVGAIANQGIMMQPHILQTVKDQQTKKEIHILPQEVRRVVSAKTAQTVAEMMVNAAKHGEAQWIFKDTHTIAGKTGTSQIPLEGGYKPDATIASFIGFAPADKPRFIMLVKLVEPTSSPWAAETAAPLWYRIAEKLFLLLNVPPDNTARVVN